MMMIMTDFMWNVNHIKCVGGGGGGARIGDTILETKSK